MKFLQKLQSKPKHVRKRIMWLATSISMALVVLIWILSFPKTYAPQEKDKTDNQEQDQPELPSFEEIKQNIKDIKNEIQDIKLPEVNNSPQIIEPDDYLEPEQKTMQLPLE